MQAIRRGQLGSAAAQELGVGVGSQAGSSPEQRAVLRCREETATGGAAPSH